MKCIKMLLCLAVIGLSAIVTANGQTARQVLDRTATNLRNAGGIEANFTATTYKGLSPNGASKGQIYVSGNKFKLATAAMTTWFNGKTQWSLLAGNSEAYVSTPTEAELQNVNPYTFVNIYRNGYKLVKRSTVYHGKACHEIELTASRANQPISRMLITVDKSTFMPVCIRIKPSKGEWVRLQINGIATGKSWPASFFEFSKGDHPNVELIDLR